jgi:hypothetical protein
VTEIPDPSPTDPRPSRRWPRILGLIAAVVLLLVAVLLLAGGGGGHGPSRHLRGAAEAVLAAAEGS